MKMQQQSTSAPGGANFGLLRARLEVELARPAVITITSSMPEDGRELAARELAHSLAATGYSTLLIDTALSNRGPATAVQGLTLDEIGRQQSVPDPRAGKFNVLPLNDSMLQRSSNQRVVQAALEILRSKFDYVVISAECGVSTSFAASLVAAADAVLVSVKTGRRQTIYDTRLAEALERIGSRFLGVVALNPAVIKQDATAGPVSDAIFNGFRSQSMQDQDRQRLDAVKSSA